MTRLAVKLPTPPIELGYTATQVGPPDEWATMMCSLLLYITLDLNE